jgi:hypothetical protein
MSRTPLEKWLMKDSKLVRQERPLKFSPEYIKNNRLPQKIIDINVWMAENWESLFETYGENWFILDEHKKVVFTTNSEKDAMLKVCSEGFGDCSLAVNLGKNSNQCYCISEVIFPPSYELPRPRLNQMKTLTKSFEDLTM